MMTLQGIDVDQAVASRYSQASKQVEGALCCPTDYSSEYLACIPKQVIERDYGCGNPTEYITKGETVLDLGSGTGKICFIASQIVGPQGKVIGVDINDDMLAISNDAAVIVAKEVGYSNVEFRKGKIQDLSGNREKIDQFLRANPVDSELALRKFESHVKTLGQMEPLISDESVDAVVSNCVLNLVGVSEKKSLFQEIFRVLKKGGRAIISDIVSDEIVPAHLRTDPKLWSGCISGAFQEQEFLEEFEKAGFYGIQLAKRDSQPWQTVEGIEFRSVTVIAYKGKEGECWDHGEAVIYQGPFASVTDDDGHTFSRGDRVAVCRKTSSILKSQPYAPHFYSVDPYESIADKDAKPFVSQGVVFRSPKETKTGGEYANKKTQDGGCC